MAGDDRPIKQRTVASQIKIDNRVVGVLEFIEIDTGPFVYDDELFCVLDSNSSIEAEMAKAICSCWSDVGEQIGAYGSILDFRSAWMHPDYAKDGLWAQVAKYLLAQEFDAHALLILKAFPLEYEGNVTKENQYFLKERQRAMIKYYNLKLGVSPLPGFAGQEGWLFSIPNRLSDVMERPAVQIGREFNK